MTKSRTTTVPIFSSLARASSDRTGPPMPQSTQRAGVTTSSEMAGLIGPDVLAQFDIHQLL
jgi:hypothetical protein